MTHLDRLLPALAILLASGSLAMAQDSAPAETPEVDAAATDAAADTSTGEVLADAPSDDTDGEAQLSAEDLQTLVAPVALYPDTLLIQVLVAATYPLDVVKADRYLADHPDAQPGDLTDDIEAQGWDESVSVLASAFPDVLNDMAVHVDWTDTVGTAMLAQSDDVMDAVQVMRDQAMEAGTLDTTEQQTVEVTQTDTGGDTIVIQPADPQVVYVPDYDPDVVYVHDDGFDAGDAVVAGLITWGTVAIIDDIFDDDDHWHGYWGCRDCGGWGGGPIIRDPDIDIDVDGDINIGNRGDIDLGDRGDINLGNRGDIGWKPDADRSKEARDKLADRGNASTGKLPVKKPDRGDQLRANLSRETGARDIARPEGGGSFIGSGGGGAAAGAIAGGAGSFIGSAGGNGNRPQISRPNVNRPASLPSTDRKQVVDRTKGAQSGGRLPTTRPAAQAVNRPSAPAAKVPKKPSQAKAPVRKASAGGNRGGAMTKRSGGRKAKAGGARGKKAMGGRKRR